MAINCLKNRIWISLLTILLMGIATAACGNRPTPQQAAEVPTDTPLPLPTATPLPKPTATPQPPPPTEPPPTPEPTLTPTPTPEPVIALVTAVDGNVNIRTGPGTNFEADGLLVVGETLEIVGRNADSSWWQVSTPDGLRWIAADVTTTSNVTEAIPIVELDAETAALAAVQPEPTATPEPTDTPEPTPTPEPATCKDITVVAPAEGDVLTTLDIEVRWRCDAELPPDHAFEVKLWLPDEAPVGAHDAANDRGVIQREGEDYVLFIPITGTAGFKGVNKDYLIAVSLVRVSPEYEDTGLMSEPVMFRYE